MKVIPLSPLPLQGKDDGEHLFIYTSPFSSTLDKFPPKSLPLKGEEDDLIQTLRFPLLIGASLGLIPIRGLYDRCKGGQGLRKLRFSWIHFRTFLSIGMTALIALNTFFITHSFFISMFSKHNSAGNLVLGFSGVWFYSVGTLIYAFFLLRADGLALYFENWRNVSQRLKDTLAQDGRLTRNVNLIVTFVFLDCLTENVLFHFHAMDPKKRKNMGSLTVDEVLKDYFDSNQYIFPFFNYNPLITLILLFTNKLTTYAWNFGDIFLMVFFMALASKFKALNSYLEGQFVADGSLLLIRKGSVSWEKVRRNFLLITKLLEDGNSLFAPLIWLSYVTDIFFVCRQLYEGLAPQSYEMQVINKVYVLWSLFHLIIRTLGVNWMAATINEHAHRLNKILQHVLPSEYDQNVRRLERYLGCRIIGISGNGCFIITRSFILMVISAIFTLEVVLLQNASITVG